MKREDDAANLASGLVYDADKQTWMSERDDLSSKSLWMGGRRWGMKGRERGRGEEIRKRGRNRGGKKRIMMIIRIARPVNQNAVEVRMYIVKWHVTGVGYASL